MRITSLMAAVSMAALLLAGTPAKAADPGVTDTEIVIGLHSAMSGTFAAFGYDPLQAAKMWLEEANKKGGIHGRKIRVVVEDDKCMPNDAVAVTKKLVTVDNVFMLMGGACSPPVAAVQEFVLREKIPFVMLNAAGDVAVFPPTRYMFGGFGGTQRSVGATLMEFAIKQFGAKRVAYLCDDNDFGTANYSRAKATADKYGVPIVAYERVSTRLTDLTAPMVNVRQANPDVIVSALYTQTAVPMTQKRLEYGIKAPLVQAVQGIPVPDVFAKAVGNDALKDFYYGSPLNDLTEGPKQQKWLQMYKATYPDRTNIGAYMTYGLPSAMAVVIALEKVGRDLTREKFVDAMETINFDSGVLAGPTTFGKDRRDGYRSSIFIKFDGTTHTLMPGVYSQQVD